MSYSMDGMELKEGMSPGASPGRNRRAPGSDSLNSSPRKRIDYDALVKAKHMPGTNVHAMATANSGSGGQELANARALVRALARKPESRQAPSPPLDIMQYPCIQQLADTLRCALFR